MSCGAPALAATIEVDVGVAAALSCPAAQLSAILTVQQDIGVEASFACPPATLSAEASVLCSARAALSCVAPELAAVAEEIVSTTAGFSCAATGLTVVSSVTVGVASEMSCAAPLLTATADSDVLAEGHLAAGSCSLSASVAHEDMRSVQATFSCPAAGIASSIGVVGSVDSALYCGSAAMAAAAMPVVSAQSALGCAPAAMAATAEAILNVQAALECAPAGLAASASVVPLLGVAITSPTEPVSMLSGVPTTFGGTCTAGASGHLYWDSEFTDDAGTLSVDGTTWTCDATPSYDQVGVVDAIYVQVTDGENYADDSASVSVSVDANGFPLQASASGHGLELQDGTPFMVFGDSGWFSSCQLQQAAMETYMAEVAAKGFNWIIACDPTPDDIGAANAPDNAYSDYPWTGTAFQSALDEDHFAYLDAVVAEASSNGIIVQLFPAYSGYPNATQWETAIKAATNQQMYDWGYAFGARYKGAPNVVMFTGGDQSPDATTLARLQYMAQGMWDAGYRRLVGVHPESNTDGLSTYTSCNINLRCVYIYPYGTSEQAGTTLIAQRAASPAYPVIYTEGNYENDALGTPRAVLRAMAYWSVLSGGCGHIYGNEDIWPMDSAGDWLDHLEDPGRLDQVRYRELFESRFVGEWQPDTSHVILTSGYGSAANTTYAPCAQTPDGATTIAYNPTASATLTVDMDEVCGGSGTAECWSYNPATGFASYFGQVACSGNHNFAMPAWDSLLVIDDTDSALGAPGADTVPYASFAWYFDARRLGLANAASVATVAPRVGSGALTETGSGSTTYDADGLGSDGALDMVASSELAYSGTLGSVQPCGPWAVSMRCVLSNHGSGGEGDLFWWDWGSGSYFVYLSWSKEASGNYLEIGAVASGMSFTTKRLLNSANIDGDEVTITVAATANLGAISLWVNGEQLLNGSAWSHNAPTNPSSGIGFHVNYNGTDYNWVGKLRALAVADHVISDADEQHIHDEWIAGR